MENTPGVTPVRDELLEVTASGTIEASSEQANHLPPGPQELRSTIQGDHQSTQPFPLEHPHNCCQILGAGAAATSHSCNAAVNPRLHVRCQRVILTLVSARSLFLRHRLYSVLEPNLSSSVSHDCLAPHVYGGSPRYLPGFSYAAPKRDNRVDSGETTSYAGWNGLAFPISCGCLPALSAMAAPVCKGKPRASCSDFESGWETGTRRVSPGLVVRVAKSEQICHVPVFL